MPNFNIDWKERRSKVKIYTDSMQALMILTDYQGFERKKLGGWVISGWVKRCTDPHSKWT